MIDNSENISSQSSYNKPSEEDIMKFAFALIHESVRESIDKKPGNPDAHDSLKAFFAPFPRYLFLETHERVIEILEKEKKPFACIELDLKTNPENLDEPKQTLRFWCFQNAVRMQLKRFFHYIDRQFDYFPRELRFRRIRASKLNQEHAKRLQIQMSDTPPLTERHTA